MARTEHHEALIAECRETIQRWIHGWMVTDYPSIALTVPHAATGEQIRLCKTGGPYSEVHANYVEGRGSTGYWDARKVLKFLENIK